MTYTLNCKGRLLFFDQPIIMGILNATPDSFYNQGRDSDPAALLGTAAQMIQEGATILDIGGLSTRPGAAALSTDEEVRRVVPVISKLRQQFPDLLISIDTYRAAVAQAAVAAGADLVNDISAGDMDKEMIPAVARLQVPYIAMHMQGTPQHMQKNPQYKQVTQDILTYFQQKLNQLKEAGIKDIIVDPGFGFGKTLADNYTLLKELHTFQVLGQPLLVGISRKSMIYNVLNNTAEESLNGTTALHMIALQQGAQILRVHDVKAANECIRLFKFYSFNP